MTATAIPANCMGIFLKPVSQGLNLDYAALSFYITVQYIAMIITLPVAGRLLNTKHMRKALLFASFCTAAALLIMSTAKSLSVFYPAGVLLGIGMGFLLFLPVPLLINAWFNIRNGLFIGIPYLFLSAGAALFNPLGGSIIQNTGWRSAYLIFALIFVCAALPAIVILRRTPAEAGLQPYGVKTGAQKLTGSMYNEALRSPLFYMIFIFAGILGILPTLLMHLPAHASSVGFTPTQGASVLSAVLIGGATGKVLIGMINDRFGVSSAITAAIGSGVAGLAALMYAPSFILMLLAGLLFGIGYSCSVVLPPLVVRLVFGTRDYSRIYSLVMVASGLGSAFGASLIGYIYSVTSKFNYIFVSIIVLMLISLIMSSGAVFLKTRTIDGSVLDN